MSSVATSLADGKVEPTKNEKTEWRLGAASYSFRFFTIFEAIDKTKSLGLDYIELYVGQIISKDAPEKLHVDLPDEGIQKIRRKLDDAGMRAKSIYIGSIPGNKEGCRKVFEFAKKLGISTIVSEPNPADLDVIEKFCDQYKINLALHNHPKGKSRYWHPREVLKACKGRGKRIGACADLGHWQRSGINPVDGVRMLGKRILTFHVKDLNEFDKVKAHDVPWGTGRGRLVEVFEEVDRQGIDPTIFAIEYEYHWKHSLPEIAECVKFFKEMAKKRKAL